LRLPILFATLIGQINAIQRIVNKKRHARTVFAAPLFALLIAAAATSSTR